jgi:hypothetical protein
MATAIHIDADSVYDDTLLVTLVGVSDRQGEQEPKPRPRGRPPKGKPEARDAPNKTRGCRSKGEMK